MTSQLDHLDLFLRGKDIKDDPFDLIDEDNWCLDNDKFLESIRYGDKIPDEPLDDDDLDVSDECGLSEEIINVDASEIITYSLEEAEEQVGSPSSASSGRSVGSSSDMNEDQNFEVVEVVGILPHCLKGTIQIVQQDDTMSDEMQGMDDSSSSPASSSEHHSYQELQLTDEEKRLLSKEGIGLPSHYPLTKYEERELKRIRRKIRNKISAQDSRKRKKEYLDKLQQKVQEVEEDKSSMSKKIRTLEAANAKLAAQVKRLQVALANATTKPSNSSFGAVPPGHGGNSVVPAATTLLVLILSLALVVLPTMQGKQKSSSGSVENSVMTAFEDGNPNMSIVGRSRTMVGVGVPMGKVNRPVASYDNWKEFSDLDEPLIKIPRFSFQTPGMQKTAGGVGLQDPMVNEINLMGGAKIAGVKAGMKRPFHGDINDLDD